MPPAAAEGLFSIRLTWMSDGNGAAILNDEEGNTLAYKMVLRWSISSFKSTHSPKIFSLELHVVRIFGKSQLSTAPRCLE